MMRQRLSRERLLRLGRQWVLLVVCLLITALGFGLARPSPVIWLWSVPAVALGGILGGLRARTIILSLDEAGRLMQRLPGHAFGLLVIILCIRPVVRGIFIKEVGATNTHSDLVVLAFAMGMVAGGRIELAVRAFRLHRPSPGTGPLKARQSRASPLRPD